MIRTATAGPFSSSPPATDDAAATGYDSPVTDDAFDPVFLRLRAIFTRHVPPLAVTADEPGNYTVDAPRPDPPAPRRYFGGVRIGRSYVSFHLMPVYGLSARSEAISPALRKRMQGKSCFNFIAVDESLFQELARLTARLAADFRMYDLALGRRESRVRQQRGRRGNTKEMKG